VVNFPSKPINFSTKIRRNSRFFAKPPFLLRPHNPYILPILTLILPILTDLARPNTPHHRPFTPSLSQIVDMIHPFTIFAADLKST